MSSKPIRNIKAVLSHFAIDGPDLKLTDLVIDSRDVGVHTAFAAVKGHHLDGRDFIPQAISLGAKLIIRQTDDDQRHGHIEMREQSMIVDFYALAEQLSALAALFYAEPAQQLDVVAVTGTNGKTSTVQLITQLRTLLHEPAASIGTLGAGMYRTAGSQLTQTSNTTPDPCQVQRLLAEFVASGAKQVALEASSHALVQKRIEGLKTDVAVFTNLSRDHLDYHGSMQEYAQAKRQLIGQSGLKTLIVNLDDEEGQRWVDNALATQQIVAFSTALAKTQIAQSMQYCLASDITFTQSGTRFELDSSWGQAQIETQLVGRFNVANLLAALATELSLGKPLKQLVEHCSALVPVAGRMELYVNPERANIIVDYAHTPDALEQALQAARAHCSGKLICVFGCGGDRDKGKRPLMGAVAQQHSDEIILTTDNSRSESQQRIVADILQGITDMSKTEVIDNRKEAIAQAMANSQPNDLILVAGKGHENYQIIGEQNLPYDERDYVYNLLQGNAR